MYSCRSATVASRAGHRRRVPRSPPVPVRRDRHTPTPGATRCMDSRDLRRADCMSKTSQALQYRLALIRLAAVTLVCVVGCDSGMPKTYPVKGKVVFAGGKSVTDGRIQFQSES